MKKFWENTRNLTEYGLNIILSRYSASGYYAIQFSSYLSPIIAFSFEAVPHSRRKCCIYNVIGNKTKVRESWQQQLNLVKKIQCHLTLLLNESFEE
ncbi:hypothetical protein [Nostoc sp. C110]|uniref:hypothetical protein n=1 Tax=Nostoc sp. C110 TaxID=3349876 RepID=UPI00370D0F14